METLSQTPPAPPAPPLPEATPPTPKAPWYKRKLIVAGIVVGVIVIIAGIAGGTSQKTGTPTASSNQNAGDVNAAPAYTPPPEPSYDVPSASDFQMGLKILEKQCFGSAGCNITYRITVGYPGAALNLDPAEEYELTYEVRGGEDGPVVNTLTLQGDSFVTDEQEIVSTSSSKSKLTVHILSVE